MTFIYYFFSGRLSVKVFKTLNDKQCYVLTKSENRKNPANLNYRMSIKKSQPILKRFIVLKFNWRLVYAGLRKRNHVL